MLYYWISVISLCVSLLYLQSLFVPKVIWISGIRAGYDSMGMRVWCIFQFQNLQQYSTNFRHVLQPPQSTFLGLAGRIFLFSIFCRIFFLGDTFADQIWNIWYKIYKNKYHIWIPLEKSPNFKKKNGSNRSSDVGDIADLKSAILSEFLWLRNYYSANMRSQSVQIRISNSWEDAKWSFCF